MPLFYTLDKMMNHTQKRAIKMQRVTWFGVQEIKNC